MLSMDLAIHHIFRFLVRYEVENLLSFYLGGNTYFEPNLYQINLPLYFPCVYHGAVRMNMFSFVYFFNT